MVLLTGCWSDSASAPAPKCSPDTVVVRHKDKDFWALVGKGSIVLTFVAALGKLVDAW